MAEDLGDKTEEPTGKRLSDAQSDGKFARSPDLASAIDLIGALIAIATLGAGLTKAFRDILVRTLDSQEATIEFDHVEPLMTFVALRGAMALAPFLLIAFAFAAVSQYLQVGFHLSTKPLIPKLDRLNPITGFANLFSKRNLVKSAINSVKLVVVLAVGWAFLVGAVFKLAHLPMIGPFQGIWAILDLGKDLALWLLAVLLTIGLTDYIYQRWQHNQDLRMTKSDVKDERRAMEGDPQIKSRRLAMFRKIALQRINSAVPKADVIVTNPTHYSIAIKYDPAIMRAPKVVAKGADELAFRIREIASTNDVPIVERPPLARALYAAVEVNQEISAEYYQAVAEVLAYVYRLEKIAA